MVAIAIPISPRAEVIGLPALRASSTDSSSWRGLHRRHERPHPLGPVARGERAPRPERGARPRDGLVDLGDAGARNLLEHRLGGGLDDCEGLAHGICLSDRRRRHGAAPMPCATGAASGSSIVRIGPLNQFLAETWYQIVTAMITSSVTGPA